MITHVTDPGLQWFDDLAADNSRDFWLARKADYARHVRQPFDQLLTQLDAACAADLPHGQWRVYRPHQDTRFNPGGPPLKTFIGAVSETPGGGGLFVQVERRGLMAALGMPYLAPDQLVTWRAAAADPTSGGQLVEIIGGLRDNEVTVRGGRPDELKRAPRGFGNDHPHIEMLRWKGVEALAWPGRDVWSDPQLRVGAVARVWQTALPLLSWLERNVGPSALERPSR